MLTNRSYPRTRNSVVKHMKFIFLYLSIMNLVDGIVTFIGLEFGFIEEGNPLMDQLYSESPFMFLAIKVLLSILLYGFVLIKQLPTTSWVKGLTIFASVSYTFVCMMHGFWIFSVV